MIELFTAHAPEMMFGSLLVFLLTGFPVAFALAACGMLFGFVGMELGLLPPSLFQALPLRVIGIIQNDTLLAIPFFTLMGAVLEKCGLAEDMLDSMGQLFGPVRGGLGYSVIIVGFVLAMPGAMMLEASLSFLGIGVAPPTPSWGQMINVGMNFMYFYWHLAVFPTAALAITVLATTLFGDGLRDALDPTMKGR